MGITTLRENETKTSDDAVRQRLFAFLARDDGSVGEILELTGMSKHTLGRFMVGAEVWADRPVLIRHALDEIDAIDNGSTVRGAAS